jgi:hypothetical protein
MEDRMTPEQTESLRKFARDLIRELAWEGGEGGDVVQDLAEKYGLIRRAPGGYAPEVHGPDFDGEPGGEIYEFSDWMKARRQ